jgi:hypothetical protein
MQEGLLKHGLRPSMADIAMRVYVPLNTGIFALEQI